MADECCGETERRCEPPPLRLPQSAASYERLGASCCAHGVPVFDGMDARYRHILWTIIAINGTMFLTEMVAGTFRARRRCRLMRSIFLRIRRRMG